MAYNKDLHGLHNGGIFLHSAYKLGPCGF